MTDPTRDLRHGEPWLAKGGLAVVIRPILPEDEPMMAGFHQALSAGSVYTRYFNVLKLSRRTAHERLAHVCHPDPAAETVLVAEAAAPDGVGREIVGVGRLSEQPAGHAGEVALVVRDSHQGRGLGTELLRRLIDVARVRRFTRVYAHVLNENGAMQRLCVNAGMRLAGEPGSGEVTATLDL